MTTSHAAHQERTETRWGCLTEAGDTLHAVRQGEADALAVEGSSDRRMDTLHSAEEPYRDLVEQMQEGAVTLTRRGDILYSNGRFATLVGKPIESVIGSCIDQFVDGSAKDDFETLLHAGAGRCRSRLIGPESRTVEVSLSLATATSNGGGRLNLIVTDLSELLEVHAHRDRIARDNHTKDEFLTMVARELRTPLGAISDVVRLLERSHAEGDAAARAHEVIGRNVDHVSSLVQALLDVTRVVSGKVELHRQPLDMAQTVRRAVEIQTRDAHLDRDIDVSTQPVWVDGDAVRLEQVLTSVVTNAVRYTPPGGRIRVALRADGGDAVLSVEDDGFGIPADLMPFIFDRYVQGEGGLDRARDGLGIGLTLDRRFVDLHGTLDRARGGLGIGLTLARCLVELHGGTIVASSEGAGHGSTLTVRLRQIPSTETSPGISDSPELRARARARRVLLIENCDDAREMMRRLLQFAGHVVYDAADGASGLELLDAVRPDVGIIDLSLPHMDGYQIARRIREEPYGRGMLLVALTGHGSANDAKRSLEHDFDHHLVKPVDPDHLKHLVSEGAAGS